MKELENMIRDSGLKKTFIAKKVGITPVYLSYLLNGKRYMSDDMKYRIIKAIAR